MAPVYCRSREPECRAINGELQACYVSKQKYIKPPRGGFHEVRSISRVRPLQPEALEVRKLASNCHTQGRFAHQAVPRPDPSLPSTPPSAQPISPRGRPGQMSSCPARRQALRTGIHIHTRSDSPTNGTEPLLV